MDITERISRNEVYATVARTIAKRSSCSRAQVGVVLVRDYRMVMTGYNGTPPGMPHCDHTCSCLKHPDNIAYADQAGKHQPDCPAGSPCTQAVHAEANAIAWAAREGVSLRWCLLVTTMAPCLPCSQLIISAGIERVMYLEDYRDPSGLQLLDEANVMLWRG